MRYRVKVHYRTELMDKITEYMQRISDDWKENDRRLVGCRVFEFEVDAALSPEEIEKIKACREDWMDDIEIEEYKDGR